jgi:hypothetical protein
VGLEMLITEMLRKSGLLYCSAIRQESQIVHATKVPIVLLVALSLAQAQTGPGSMPPDSESYCQTISAAGPQSVGLRGVCEFAISLHERLPKFVCNETVKRYELGWGRPEVPLDDVSAEATFEHGHDSYDKIMLNHGPTNRSMAEVSGMSSVGEFGGLLQAIFTQRSKTEFKFKKEHKLDSRPAVVFAFRVAMENNKSWWLRMRGTVIFPGYDGALWLDKATSQLMRLEVRASEMPPAFSETEVTTTVDYVDVPFSNGSKFPLPARSETTTRFQRSRSLFRNKTTFTDCHQFVVKSRIVSGQ